MVMEMRKKLVSLIREVTPYWAEVLSDYLMVNGVTIPVRCKDCKHYVLQACACRHENFNGIIPMNGYCYYGERKDNAV
jgi:hypothetical protein